MPDHSEAARRWAQTILPSLLLATAVLARVAKLETVEAFQNKVFDTYQALSPRPYRPARVRVVDIDGESLARLGSWPWPRALMARLVSRLSELGASTIAFDVVFAEPDYASPRQLIALLPKTPEGKALRAQMSALPDNDRLLAQAISKSRVITGFTLTTRQNSSAPALKAGVAYSGDSPLSYLPDFGGATVNLPEIEAASAGNGSFSILPESDGVIRRVPLLVRLGKTVYPSLSLEALRVDQGASSLIVKSSGGSRVLSFGQHTGISWVKAGRIVLPTDSAGRLWPRYSRRSNERVIPAWRLLEPDFPKERVAGMIVFVGSSAERLQDLRATPIDPATPGVEIHAQIAEQALLGEFLSRPDWAEGVELFYTLALGILLILMLPRLGAAWSGLLGLSVAAAAFPLSWYAYSRLHWLFDPLFPFLSALAIYITASLLGYLRAEAQRNRLMILDAVKDELVATVSHDLRGPVNSMVMLVDAMRKGFYGPLSDKQNHNLELIENQGRRLNDFVTNVLDTAKIKAGKLELHRQSVQPREMLPPLVELFAVASSAKSVALTAEIAEDLPEILADREKLEQALNNLITNALKFTPKGGSIVVAAARDGNFVRFSVTDTGLGISAANVAKLFKPFQQVDLARQKESGISGTGLGLSICKFVVEAHGGKIWVESQEKKGASFRFTIPALKAGSLPT